MTTSKTPNKLKSYAIIVKSQATLLESVEKGWKGNRSKETILRPRTRNLRNSNHLQPCPHCQRTNHPPEKYWSCLNAANRLKRFKQEYPADNQNHGQEQGNLTSTAPSSILKNSLNQKSHDSNGQITHQ